MKCLPSSTIGIHFAPSRHRQLFSASRHSLNTIDKVAARDPHPLVFAGAAVPLQRSTRSGWSIECESSVPQETRRT